MALRTHAMPAWARYASATSLVLATAALPSWWGAAEVEHPFVLFFPAIVASALFFAQGAGILAALLSAAVIATFLLGPAQSFAGANSGHFLPLAVFVVVGAGTAAMIEMLHRAFFTLAQVNTELAAARDRIAAAEHEKDTLLHEVTHRFKNELGSLIGLLRLQARTVDDPVARSELLAASDRVHVMGRVHQRLSNPGNRMVVDVREFLNDLLDDLRASMIGPRPVTLCGDIDSGLFSLTHAVAIGLITNELVTNALKYAFPDDRPGRIDVRFVRGELESRLIVSDDGVGVSAPATSGGLGERLIRSLARQLGGNFEVIIGAGGRTGTATFPSVQS